MRRAMDLIHFVVKDGVLNSTEACVTSGQKDEDIDSDRATVYSCMRHLQRLLDLTRVTLGNYNVSPFFFILFFLSL